MKFHESLKQQKLKTFDTLYSVPVSLDNDKTVAIKADRDLLRRVVVALESGREVDADTLLQRRPSPVPLSITTFDGCLRLTSSKSDLDSTYRRMCIKVSHPSATIRGALLFGEWSDNFTAFVVSHFWDKWFSTDSFQIISRESSKSIRRDVESRKQRIGN